MIHRVLRKPVLLNDKTCFEKASSFKKKKKKKRKKYIYKKELRKGILRQTLELCKLPWLACMMCLPFLSLRLPPAICISCQYISLTAFPLLIFLLIWQCWKMDFP